jgi:hypothetical protein
MILVVISSIVLSTKYLLPLTDVYSCIYGTCNCGTLSIGFSGSFPFFCGGGALPLAAVGLFFSSSAFLDSSYFFSSSNFFNASSSSFFCLSSVSF